MQMVLLPKRMKSSLGKIVLANFGYTNTSSAGRMGYFLFILSCSLCHIVRHKLCNMNKIGFDMLEWNGPATTTFHISIRTRRCFCVVRTRGRSTSCFSTCKRKEILYLQIAMFTKNKNKMKLNGELFTSYLKDELRPSTDDQNPLSSRIQ